MRGIEQIPWLYDALMAWHDRSGFIRWRRRLAAWARGRVLEVGCGTGRNLPLFAGETLVGCDPHLAVLAAARRRAPGAALVLARAEALPFRPSSFETVVSCLTFCSVFDPRRGLREVARVMASSGRLLMIEHVRHRHPWLGRWQDLIQPAWTAVSGGCHPNRDTEKTVRDAGFIIEEVGRRERGTLRLFAARLPD